MIQGMRGGGGIENNEFRIIQTGSDFQNGFSS